MSETREQREARWARGRARDDAWRASPEHAAWRADRIARGLCVIEDVPFGSFKSVCVTHGVKADLGHDLTIHGTTNPDGSARND